MTSITGTTVRVAAFILPHARRTRTETSRASSIVRIPSSRPAGRQKPWPPYSRAGVGSALVTVSLTRRSICKP